MTAITVDVSITSTNPLTATYKSSTDGVDSNGDITIDQGESATITFNPAPDSPIQGWSFTQQSSSPGSPWVTITGVSPTQNPPPGPVPAPANQQGANAVIVNDDDENKSEEDMDYEYTLYTTLGQLDPRIINKPGGNQGRRRGRGRQGRS